MTNRKITDRLRKRVRRFNINLLIDALLKIVLGLVFTVLVFAFVFWFGWFFGVLAGPYVNLHAWQFGTILAGSFLFAATWSAWRHVDPLAGLTRLSDEQMMATMLSLALGGIGQFSPRHAIAGAAVILIGGPTNVLHGFCLWASRLRWNQALLLEASGLLTDCDPNHPTENLHGTRRSAAALLWRLALIRVVRGVDSPMLTLTQAGSAVLNTVRKSAQKQ